ncbi:hypothetical protein [Magnetospirillum sp. UT-4]|uniref:hypothetical protein n=1 Tax=Magnetospirillum sp. UT-4 TaxID=2681467 RepID=UPI00137D854E|nr:hypothetical protein [Magnetospirillum sp. UT-4]CAA7622527.1 membrane hypothetical protein [Magnetospirillum sp. UT-4]
MDKTFIFNILAVVFMMASAGALGLAVLTVVRGFTHEEAPAGRNRALALFLGMLAFGLTFAFDIDLQSLVFAAGTGMDQSGWVDLLGSFMVISPTMKKVIMGAFGLGVGIALSFYIRRILREGGEQQVNIGLVVMGVVSGVMLHVSYTLLQVWAAEKPTTTLVTTGMFLFGAIGTMLFGGRRQQESCE